MIPVTEFRQFTTDQNPRLRVLKPWWDVFTEYICTAMLMIGVFGCTLQLTQDKIACLPIHQSDPYLKNTTCNHITGQHDHSGAPHMSADSGVQEMFGRKNNLDVHQYIYVNYLCYEKALHWYAKYFPYLVVINSIIFMICSSFWFKFPGTSSKIELFISILGKCFDSPWTTRALSEVSEERKEEKMVVWRRDVFSKTNSLTDGLVQEEETVGLLRSASTKSKAEKKLAEQPPDTSALDKKEGEQAKALFEKVKKFRSHVEEADILYFMYVLQTCLKVFMVILIIIYSAVLVSNIKLEVPCSVDAQFTGFDTFCCSHTKAHLFAKLAYCYICLLSVYGLVCFYTLYWLVHRPLKEYSYDTMRLETGITDIPDLKNDFAFLLHLSDQYDALYAKRFAVFLSEVSEGRLRQMNMNNEWTAEKLRQRLSRNAQERLELHLLMLSGLPDTVFEMAEVEVLKLELLTEVTIPGSVAQMSCLQELCLVHCPAKLQLAALHHLRSSLRVLRLTFDGPEQVPMWMYTLHSLEELHLTGSLSHELQRSPSLDTLRELRSLKLLVLRCRLPKVPHSVTDVGAHLQKLRIYNEGGKLHSFSSLKKMSALTSLELVGCELERIPHAVFSLANLQALDLKDNRLTSAEEVLSLQHCRRLTTLKLWHNGITCVPDHIRKLRSLESLHLCWNKISSLPAGLFYCVKLRHLDLSHNLLASLPPEVRILQNLQFLSAAHNALASLPDELFSCRRLQTLLLGHNSLSSLSPKVAQLTQLVQLELKDNGLEALPPEIGECRLLRRSGLAVEDTLFDLLPAEVRAQMKDS
ncbi:volume-regulated anion channel subunit LRRC8E [Amia ocellicauda]|uniref:volume-regulated anion channel subunit LRRC8E n=1 Tax=Amia ocellicauda TaxID=2972642 RepID=UPI00346462DB